MPEPIKVLINSDGHLVVGDRPVLFRDPNVDMYQVAENLVEALTDQGVAARIVIGMVAPKPMPFVREHKRLRFAGTVPAHGA